MSWVTIIWSMVASACLTLAVIYLLVWCRKRTAWANLFFSLAALATAAVAFCEYWMMRAQSPEEFGTALRWLHVAFWPVLVALVCFVRVYLRAGRPWLAWTVYALRTFSLLPNFLVGQNLNYREVTGLLHVRLFGESVSVGQGVSSPWMLVGQVSLLLFLVFVADAAVTVWRRGDRRQATVVGGSLVFFVLSGTVQAVLVLWGIVHWPMTISLFYMGIVVAMGYEMSREVYLAAQLSDDLRESEERMTLAAEAAGFGVWMWSIPHNQVWGSEKWLRLYGFAPDAAITLEEVIQRIHPDDRARVEREVRRAVEDRGDYAGEYRVVLPDGAQRWIVARGRMHPDANGKPARMLGAAIDITYRKQAEEELREGEERFRQVAESVGDFIWEVDAKGLYKYANPHVEQILGYTPEELVGKKHFYDLFAPSVRDELKAAAFQAFANQRPFRDFPNANVSKSGKIVHLETSGAPVLDSAGNLVGYRGVDTDVTGRKQSELEIAQQRNELAHLSRVNMLGELAGSLAHELNQPLTAILSNAQAGQRFLAEDNADINEVRDILKDIATDDQRAGEIIRRLRMLLRKGEVQHLPLSLNEVVRDVLKLVRNDLLNHSVMLHTEFAADLPVIKGDRVQLQQVLLNLIVNAIDAMAMSSPGDKQLLVRTERSRDDGVRVAVADQGTGLAPEVLERLYAPYFTTKPTGMGLGLKVCRTIITAHGGWLAGDNNPDKGATFHFTLPQARKEQP